MKTDRHLKIQEMGDAVLGVRLEGDVKKPEPVHFRVCFPGGDVDGVRTTDNDYWVHVRVNTPWNQLAPGEGLAKIIDARLDITGKAQENVDVGDINCEKLYHMAVRVNKI